STGKVVRSLAGSRGKLEQFAISADGKYLLGAHAQNHWTPYDPALHGGQKELRGEGLIKEWSICLWEVDTGKEAVLVSAKNNKNVHPPFRANGGDAYSSLGGPGHGFRVRISPVGTVFFTPPWKPLSMKTKVKYAVRELYVLDVVTEEKLCTLESPLKNYF